MRSWFLAVLLAVVMAHTTALGQAPVLPPGDPDPLFKLEAGGPVSYVSALAFSPDGTALYAGGWDKVVRVWKLDAASRRFVLDERTAYRMPMGPGVSGSINALALSGDGQWLAVAGNGLRRGAEDFRRSGKVLPLSVLTPEMQQDQGLIYLFDLNARADQPGVRLLRGHRGYAVALAFAPPQPGGATLLVSAAQEEEEQTRKPIGTVHLWNVDQGALVAQARGLPEPRARPGLAVWRSGAPVQVALAWGDGQFRVWNTSTGEVQRVADGSGGANLTVVPLPGRDRVLTGSYRNRQGHFQAWRIRPGRAPQADLPQLDVAPGGEGGGSASPLALTLLSGQANGALDHAALVLWPAAAGPGRTVRLQVRRLDGRLVTDLPLWAANDKQPVVAAAPRGRYLAVAGTDEHDIAVYAIDRLLTGKPTEPQQLHGVGATQRYVGFVTSGRDVGLVLNEQAKARPGATPRAPQAGDLVFDFSRQRLVVPEPGTWHVNTPALEGWEVRLAGAPDGRERLTVLQGGVEKQQIPIDAALRVTDYAFLPPRPPLRIPLLAVALHQRGEPLLRLYHAQTGNVLRHYTGHAERIYSLAFSADGRLLASAADDQIVAVWSLTDLDIHIGRRGGLPGLEVKASPQGRGLLVHRLDRERLPVAGLARNDVIEGIRTPAGLQEFARPLDFYDHVWRLKPGETVALQVRGKPPVRLPVAQGIDSQKPLISLFITQAASIPERDWIGWNTLGLYETSSRKAERYLGWHFNTGKPDGPTRFALADQYRRVFHRPGILKQLLADGRAPPPAPPRPLPRPGMALWIDEVGPDPGKLDDQGQVLVQQPKLTLKLAVDGYPLEKLDDWIDWVKWQVDGQALEPFASSLGREWSIDLSQKVLWKRGVYRCRAVLRTREAEAKEYTAELLVRYQPSAPGIAVTSPRDDKPVAKSEFRFQAEVRPGQAGQPVTIRLLHRHPQVGLVREYEYEIVENAAAKEIDELLNLKPGPNEITLVAVNQAALPHHERHETQQVVKTIVYLQPREDQPPQLHVQVRPLLDQGVAGAPLTFVAGTALVVESERVRLSGTIAAVKDAGPLQMAEWLHGEAEWKPLAGFQPQPKWDFQEDIALQPGAGNRIRIRSKTQHSPVREIEVRLDFRPLLPRLRLTTASDGLRLYEGRDAPTLPLKAQLLWPGTRHPCQAVLLVNDEPRGQPMEIAKEMERLTASVPLEPGSNSVRVQLRNAWQRVEVSEAVQVSYLRPPRLKPLPGPVKVTEPLLDLEAEVHSQTSLEAHDIRVNDRHQSVPVDVVAIGRKEEHLWKVRLKGVALDRAGKNTIALWISNSEPARSLQPAAWTVDYQPPQVPTLPEVEILEPSTGQRTSDPLMKVRFHVRSVGRPDRLTLVQEGDGIRRDPLSLDVLQLKQLEKDLYAGEARVKLIEGVNRLHVVAVNKHGSQHRSVDVSYARMPIRVVMDQLAPWESGDASRVPRGHLVASAESRVHSGQLWLYGRVVGIEPGDRQLQQVAGVRVLVNGIPQLPAELEAPNAKQQERSFRVPIVLNREHNQIQFETANVPLEAADRAPYVVICLNPIKSQRLHLLIVSTEKEDTEGLLCKRALEAVRATPKSRSEFTTPAFEQGFLYEPLTGLHITHRYLRGYLGVISRKLVRPDQAGPRNEVVMVYYQGRESVNAEGQFQWADFSWKEMEAVFEVTPGAAVLFLDVTREPTVRAPTPWPGDTRVGVFRFAWLGQAAPPDVRLLKVLQESMPRAQQLKDLAEQLGKQFVSLTRAPKYKQLQHDGHLPDVLASVAIGAGR